MVSSSMAPSNRMNEEPLADRFIEGDGEHIQGEDESSDRAL